MGYILCRCCLIGSLCFDSGLMFVCSWGHLWYWRFINYYGRFWHLRYWGFVNDLWWFRVIIGVCLIASSRWFSWISFWFHLFIVLLCVIVMSWLCWLTVMYCFCLPPKYMNRFWEAFSNIGNPIYSGPSVVFNVSYFLYEITNPMYMTILFYKFSHIIFLCFQENI